MILVDVFICIFPFGFERCRFPRRRHLNISLTGTQDGI